MLSFETPAKGAMMASYQQHSFKTDMHALSPLLRAWRDENPSHRSVKVSDDAVTLRVQDGLWRTFRYATREQAHAAITRGELANV